MASKKKSQPPRPARLKEGGRWSEGYGPKVTVGNPGAGVTKRAKSASDYIRPPLKKVGKKQVTRGGTSAKAGYADAAEVGWMPSSTKKSSAKKGKK